MLLWSSSLTQHDTSQGEKTPELLWYPPTVCTALTCMLYTQQTYVHILTLETKDSDDQHDATITSCSITFNFFFLWQLLTQCHLSHHQEKHSVPARGQQIPLD